MLRCRPDDDDPKPTVGFLRLGAVVHLAAPLKLDSDSRVGATLRSSSLVLREHAANSFEKVLERRPCAEHAVDRGQDIDTHDTEPAVGRGLVMHRQGGAR